MIHLIVLLPAISELLHHAHIPDANIDTSAVLQIEGAFQAVERGPGESRVGVPMYTGATRTAASLSNARLRN